MADNTVVNAGSGGDTIASDDIGGVKHQRIKLSVGADGSASDAIPVSNGLDTTAAGVAAVGIVGQFDDVGTGAVTENQFAPVRISTRRALLVEGVASGTAQPVSGTVAVTNADLTTIAALSKAEDAAHGSGDTGVMALAVRAAAPTERSAGPTDGDYEPLAVNEVGAVWSTLTPSANGGLTTFMASGSDGSSILVATSQVIKASAGVLYGYYAYNPEAAVTFVHFYNTASASVTVGTTNPLFTIAIPAGSAANLALPYGITFSNAGWACAATTTAAGNTAPATGVSLVAWYK